jgi:asparagine synthase (glutamine-hydrolysing)
MCGIVGVIQKNNQVNKEVFDRMLYSIAHRGPEDQRVWFDAAEKVAFGHRRLAIIDLSEGGAQPRVSPDGRYVITFNGEIYNYRELKEDLTKLGWQFISNSDTEVLLYSYIQWKEECLQKFNGMFAFAIWDQYEQKLFAARDRLGEKPFKYYYTPEKFIFASEIKALLQDQTIIREIDWSAVDTALSFRFVPAPATGFKKVHKLPAAHYLIWKNSELTIRCYWSPDSFLNKVESKTEEEWKKELWDLFLDSVKHRLISDVPVGAFLSGGIDSTSVVAAVKELDQRPLKTFVISINGKSADQAYAKKAAEYFGTDHHEVEINEIDYIEVLNRLIGHYDEPFFDQSALPSLLISQEIKKYVTVVLAGDGGDELYGGYRNHQFITFLTGYFKLPQRVRSSIAHVLKPFKNAGYKAEVLSKTFYEAYTNYYSLWKNHLPLSKRYLTKTDLYRKELKDELNLNAFVEIMKQWFGGIRVPDVVNQSMVVDIKGQLADGYLTKMDVATMANSLEVRPPFLDYRLVERSVQMPSSLKIKEGKSKYIWKEIIKNKIPIEIIERPKTGFSIPLDVIMKTHLKPLIEDVLLSNHSLIARYFLPQTIQRL